MYWFSFSISLIGLLYLFLNTFLFVRLKRTKKEVSKVFVFYLITLSIIEFFCNLIGLISPNSNFFISHFYFVSQFYILSFLFYSLFHENKIKHLIKLVAIVQTIFLVYTYYSNVELFCNFNIYEIVSCSIILIFYGLLFILKNFDTEHQYLNFSLGLILYLSCSISIFVSGNFDMVLCEKPYIDIWIFNSIFYILFQFLVYREYRFIKNS
ncbi:hypothetical protein SAMN05444337_0016 [Flavobacterium haoranii]|uniref:YhhN-like protein n=1 Tax=Flavobacterium haoranii TaxID=683124 RepID=A0A1M6B742_9FLAO|nr:hypothetical protein SAMN05444337_0016 [Flavobacterium haoranii]